SVGLADDCWGRGEHGGLSGHFRQFLVDWEISTGLLKAVVISIFTILIVEQAINDFLIIKVLNFLVVVLLTNFVNLLDLRPGRAGKGFIIMGLITVVVGDILVRQLLLPLLLMVVILLPIDLHAEAMLGDSGANLLGAYLGLSLLFTGALIYKIILVMGLLLVHLYAERASLTELIAANRYLTYLDYWGREKS
ncbi:MAG: glycosyl transferase family 4, partial [Bacillota bacterium]